MWVYYRDILPRGLLSDMCKILGCSLPSLSNLYLLYKCGLSCESTRISDIPGRRGVIISCNRTLVDSHHAIYFSKGCY